MRELSLFTGAGGGVLGSVLLGHRVVCAVECDPYCQEVLLRRQEEGHLQAFPIWDDAKTFSGLSWRGVVDLVSGGFPCQPFSVAGARRAEDDPRNMWPDTIRIIREVGPRWAFLENVPGLLSTPYWGTILGDLAEAGFDAEWTVLGADDCGANHRRKRVWVLAANAELMQLREQPGGRSRPSRKGAAVTGDDGETEYVADTERPRLKGRMREAGRTKTPREPEQSDGPGDGWDATGFWASESGLDRVANGVAHRVDRSRVIGNGQVPIVAARAFRLLMQRFQ